jgi:hypothetical protein
MKVLKFLIVSAGAVYCGAALSQAPHISAADAHAIDALIERVYQIPYRDVVCAFSDLNPDTHAYVDKKFSEKRVRAKAYQSTFGRVFSSELFNKFNKSCVDTDWAGLKPDFRTGDEDTEDDYLYTHAPILTLTAKPVIIEQKPDRVRLKVLWKQIYSEGKNTQKTTGRTDFILAREQGQWRINDAIANTTYDDEANLSVSDFEKTIGVKHLKSGR